MRYLLLITCLACFKHSILQAQEKRSLLETLKYYESDQDIKFSFDPSLVELISTDFAVDQDFETFIDLVEEKLPFTVQKISPDFYTLVVAESNYSLSLIDSLESSVISPPLFVLINSDPATVSIADDRISFSYKPSLNDTLIVYAPGYTKRRISVSQLLNEKNLTLKLMTHTLFLSDVLIEDYLTKGINLNPSNQKITIDVKDLPLLPGETDGDIFASLAALPGVTTPDGRPGNLFIRGNSADQSLILFDNIPIYHRGHYFGTISPYNPKVVDNVEVYRSGYHPRMGGRVGGAIFVNSNAEVNNQAQYGLGMNTLYGTAYAKTPILDNKLGLTIGARHSYPTSVKSTKLNAISESVFSATALEDANGNLINEPDVLFSDYHTKLLFLPKEKHEIAISGIYSNTNLSYEVSQSLQSDDSESIDFENYGLNAEWKHQFTPQWDISLINTISRYAYNNKSQTTTFEFFAVNELTDYNSRLEVSKSTDQGQALQLGLDYKWQSSTIDYSNLLMADQTPINISSTTTAHTFSPFANIEWNGLERWFVQLGLRGSYYSPKSSFQWSPRLAANYDLSSWIRMKASAGLYHQYLSQVKNLEFGSGGFDNELWMLTGDMNGNIISGEQYMTGVMFNKNQWLLDIEAYYKTANGITYYEDRRFNEQSIYFTADDLIYGLDAYFKRDVGEHGSAWIGYSYSNSKIKLDTTDRVTYKSKYIQPHLTYLGYAYNKGRWKFSTVWKYGSGLNAKSLEIAFAEVLFQRGRRNPNPTPGSPPPPNPFANVPERYPSIWSVDLSASYKIPKTDSRKWSASFGLSVINVFDQSNLIDRAFRGNPPPPQFIDREALGFAPNIMVMIEW